jgi:hypothetical protein
MLSSGVALATTFLRALELFVQAFATPAALPRGTVRPRRIVTVCTLIGRSFPAAIFVLGVGATSASAAVLILHLRLWSPLQRGVVDLSYPGRINLVHNIIRRERERLGC